MINSFEFEAPVIHWRGPSPFYFAQVPPDVAKKISALARTVSYGWGVIPVEARIEEVVFRTSLFPKDGGYLLPLKVAVRKRIAVSESGVLNIAMVVGPK